MGGRTIKNIKENISTHPLVKLKLSYNVTSIFFKKSLLNVHPGQVARVTEGSYILQKVIRESSFLFTDS